MQGLFTNGSSWLRMDVHLHTKEDKEFKYNGNDFIKEYVDKLEIENIKIGIVTNHNKFNWHEFKKLKKEAISNDIFLLPGVELTIADGSNGIHALIVFDENEWLANGENTINKFLDSVFLGTDNREHANVGCKLSLLETINKLEDTGKNYFIIMAHVEDSSGFLRELGGGRIIELAKEKMFVDNVIGCQKLTSRDNINKLRNWLGYDIALVEGSDPKCVDEIGKGKKCYVKIGELSFNAIKFALKDHDSRVSCNKGKRNHAYVKSIKFQGGKLDGSIISLSKNLNTLIGIRGSGKSTIIELLRYGLGLELSINSKDKEYKNNLVKNAITSGGKTVINIRDIYDNEYIIERLFGHDIHICNERGEELEITLETIIGNPLYFGQKDLCEVEGYEEALLEKLIGNVKKNIDKEIITMGNELSDNFNKFLRLKNTEEDIKECETNINSYRHKLELFEEHEINVKLENQIKYESDKRHIQDTKSLLIKYLEKIKSSMVGDKDIRELLNYTTTLNNEIIDELHISIRKTITAISIINNQIAEIDTVIGGISNIEDKFQNKFREINEEFASIKREIDIPNLDLNDYMKYTQMLMGAKTEIKRLEASKKEREDLKIKIKGNIRRLNDLWLEEYRIYESEIQKINQRQDKLLIDINYKEDRKAFLENIKQILQGSHLRNNDYEKIVDKYRDYIEILADIYLGENKFKNLVGTRSYVICLDLFESNMQDLLTYKVPNKININYHGKPLAQHSIGQRASALILFLLTQEDNSLIIIDQPEDDLDNQVIYDELISNIKERKDNIQFIFATHNANIPVLGDAEQVLASYYNNNKIYTCSGSIDKKEIQERIIKIMEGGQAAFKKRNRIYRLWKYDI